MKMEARMSQDIADAVNVLGAFCGQRDVQQLTHEHLEQTGYSKQADVLVLYGGSILCGVDVLAEAMRAGAARRYVISGGEGHTTEALRSQVKRAFPGIDVAGKSEAELFDACLRERYGLHADYLECASTNCGNNITYVIDLFERERIEASSVILCQDATMQRRMGAGMRLHAPELEVVNFATYRATVAPAEPLTAPLGLSFEHEPQGMWDMERYVSLLMGEVPRLTDDAAGYGPHGAGYIAHVDIPEEVQMAFTLLKEQFPHLIREANPAFAS